MSNKYRVKEYVFSIWKDSFIATKEHFYHVGAKEENRNAVYEGLVSNVPLRNSISTTEMQNKIENGGSQLTSAPTATKESPQLLLDL